MGAEIDRLELQVEAQATKANNQLDKLVVKLDKVSGALSKLNGSGLSGLANGVSKFAQASAQLSNVKTADFTRLTKNIQSLSNINTQQIYGAASAMKTLSTAINSLGGVSSNSLQVAEVAKSISKLGGANVQRAITNLPALAVAMNNLMDTLSRAPQVNRNIIDMTNALANLASRGNRVGTAGNSLTRSLNTMGNAMHSTTKKARNFSSVIGSIYQKYFWIMRIGRKFWSSIENSMNYVEVLNYFDAAFGQVANNAVSQWEEAGYDSAEAYYNSFSSRAKELTSKMTGFNVNSDGTLTATGNASLGINPTKLMNYQATFAQMASSMSVTSETSLLLSQALTEIGADLASVKNMDFDKVWTDMASGLAGMSRTLDKYGVNIRNVNLQQKLFDLGINENITNLNQNDKALLRTIILLDSTQYAWGDLADTINQPANQMRLLESNLGNLSRTIGNLFLPAVAKVLPYVNGLVIAFQRLFTWLGSLMGIDLSEITSSIGSSEVDMSELLGDTEELTGNLDDATKAAEKLKKGIRSFDELNVINTSDDAQGAGGTGLKEGLLDKAFLDSFSKYQKAWDKAFANMENRANKFADNIEKYFKPIKDIINDIAIGDFYKAGQDTSNLVSGIYNFFAEAIDKVDWDKAGDKIGDYLSGIDWIKIIKSAFKLKFNIWKAIAEIWFGAFEAAPIETAILTTIGLLKFTGLGSALAVPMLAAISASPLYAKIASVGALVGKSLIGGFVAAVGGFAFGQWLNEVITGEKIDMSWAEQFNAIKESFSDGSWKDALNLWGKDIKEGLNNISTYQSELGYSLGEKFKKWLDETTVYQNELGKKAADWFMEQESIFVKFGENCADKFKGFINDIFGFIEEKTSKGVAGYAIATPLLPISPQYAIGGFPEDGFFYANHTELVGRFTNGKTAVANNEQIVSGIEAGVERAVASVLAPYLADIAQNTRETADKEWGITKDDIGASARQYAKEYYHRTGDPAYSF